jgi:hypothetical protein
MLRSTLRSPSPRLILLLYIASRRDKQRPLNDLLFREPNIIAAEISDIASVRPEELAPLDSRAQTRSVKPTLNFLQRFFPTSAVKNE